VNARSQNDIEHAMKTCCGLVEWPCCSHESCCDAYEAEGLDQEDEGAAEKQLSPVMLAQIPAWARSGLRRRMGYSAANRPPQEVSC